MAKHDLRALNNALPLPELASRLGLKVERQGEREYKACCPFHKEKTPSFSIFQGTAGWKFYCFGCGASGDSIDYVQGLYDIRDPREAMDRLAEIVGGAYIPAPDHTPREIQRETERKDPWQVTTPPADEPAPATLWVRRGDGPIETPVLAAWPYHDRHGQLQAYVCRVELEPGKKDVIPVVWKTSTDTGDSRWKQGSLAKPRLLYGTELLEANPTANIVLVEGEKACDAARRLLEGTGLLAMTWPGGCKAVEHADWSLLEGRKVVGWPDCDSQRYADNHPQAGEFKPYHEQPGMAAMLRIAALLERHGAAMRILEVPAPGELENGWDAADAEAEGWDQARTLAWIKTQLRTPAELQPQAGTANQEHQDDQEPPSDHPPLEAYHDYTQRDEDDDDRRPDTGHDMQAGGEPFRILGWDRGHAYYLPDGFRQVVELSPTAHSKLNLMQLAPLHHWESYFPSGKKTGDKVAWDLAAESLIRRAQRIGVWDPELIRGRGAWLDRGRPVVHIGDRLIIDGESFSLREAPTDYVYEIGRRFSIATENPLSNSEAHRFVQLCEFPRWERPIFGKLLAGWVFLAPICGALQWRPHIWITGGAGSGKTTVMNELVNRPLARTKLAVKGDTSEAGIRRTLGMDAIPVVFEEFDSENKNSAQRVENVMALVTQASAEGEGKIIKANNTGGTVGFQIRSMFAFNSIAVNLSQYAARTRVTVLGLVSNPETPEGIKAYQQFMRDVHDTMTPAYIDRLQARAVSLIPVIRQNAETFAKAAAITLRSRRFGDQIGTLLAGVYALHSTALISDEAALEWIERQGWEDEREANDTRDEDMCLQHILHQHLRVETRDRGQKTRTIAELVERISGSGDGARDRDVTADEAYDTLKRVGIRIDRGGAGFVARIACNHRELARILADTPWVHSWGRTLKRLPGARSATQRFGATAKCVEIDVTTILGIQPLQGDLKDF